jgi:methylmalonyl-CoA mutase N-terminal domain/subunit
LDQIPLDKVSTSMTINAPAGILLAMYIAVAEKQGVAAGQAAGHHPERHPQGVLQPGHLYLPAQAIHAHHHRHLRLLRGRGAQLEHHQHQRLPHPGGRGSTAVQEVAFTLANGLAYVQAAVDAGLEGGRLRPRLSFFFNAHSEFLEEVAKYRAARRCGPGS